jgi:hypothetical protein
MKNFTPVTLLSALFILCIAVTSCKKEEAAVNKPLAAVSGRWFIERIQLRLYNGSVFVKDSIVPRAPKGSNFLDMDDATKAFQYRFNSYTTDIGTYVLKGTDSIIATTPANVYRWKMLTLTDEIFTARNVRSNDPSFPGMKVETYYTFARN